MKTVARFGLFSLLLPAFCLLGSSVQADPCGMVPPITVGDDVPIARVGYQQTYVFYKDGVETFVIHPGYKGKIDEFDVRDAELKGKYINHYRTSD